MTSAPGRLRLWVLARRGMKLGKNVTVMRGVFLDPSHCWHITIGDDVTLARNVMVFAHDASTKRHLGLTKVGEVVIGDRVFVGANTIILPDVRIGPDCVIGAGSVVTKDVPPRTVVAGSPARPLCTLDEWLVRRSEDLRGTPRFSREQTWCGGVGAGDSVELAARVGKGGAYVP